MQTIATHPSLCVLSRKTVTRWDVSQTCRALALVLRHGKLTREREENLQNGEREREKNAKFTKRKIMRKFLLGKL